MTFQPRGKIYDRIWRQFSQLLLIIQLWQCFPCFVPVHEIRSSNVSPSSDISGTVSRKNPVLAHATDVFTAPEHCFRKAKNNLFGRYSFKQVRTAHTILLATKLNKIHMWLSYIKQGYASSELCNGWCVLKSDRSEHWSLCMCFAWERM